MQQGDPGVIFARPHRRHDLPRWQLRDQIEVTPLSLRGVGEDLGVEPFQPGEIETIRPVGEEQLHELGEEFLQQGLEPLVVVGHSPSG